MSPEPSPPNYKAWQWRERWLGAAIVLGAAAGGGLLYLIVTCIVNVFLR